MGRASEVMDEHWMAAVERDKVPVKTAWGKAHVAGGCIQDGINFDNQQRSLADGKKYDAGKAPIFQGAIRYFPRALAAVAQVSAYGLAKYKLKYEDKNWAKVDDGFGRYSNALARHLVDEVKPGHHDPESGLMHAAHAAWNALARLEILLQDRK